MTAASTSPRQEMAELSEVILASCRHRAVSMTYQRGDTIVGQGEAPTVVRFIEEGLCKLVWRSLDGRQALMGFRMRGWSIGGTLASWSEPQPFATEAMTRCAVRQVPIASLMACAEENPFVMRALSRVHALELAQAYSFHLLGLASLPARTRVEMLLSWLHAAGIGVHDERHGVAVTSTLSQREMADVLAMAPETLTRVIRVLEREGLMVKRNGWITLCAVPSDASAGWA